MGVRVWIDDWGRYGGFNIFGMRLILGKGWGYSWGRDGMRVRCIGILWFVYCCAEQIWTLSDIDKDGNLDLDEFCVVRNSHSI